MANRTEELVRYRHSDGTVAWAAVTFDVPADRLAAYDAIPDSDFSEADEDLCNLVSVDAVNETPASLVFRLWHNDRAAPREYTLAPYSTFSGTPPFPGGLKTLGDVNAWEWRVA